MTVSFLDYIRNVASSEIYPTWPEEALRANIYAQLSFALNRIYTEFYRTQGYDFDITNNTAYDQAYVEGRDIFANISELAAELFRTYIRRPGQIVPLFTPYCNGVSSTCEGLSQWETVELAEQGLSALEILKYYFGEDIELVENVPIVQPEETAPDPALELGSEGDAVRLLQTRLNTVSVNYPNIPKIPEVNGIFDDPTLSAVLEFQRTFNLTPDGIVGRATWYELQRVYIAVRRLSELDSGIQMLEDVEQQFPGVLQQGSSGSAVRLIQYYLNVISQYEDEVPSVTVDGNYGPATAAAVRAFQRFYGLTPDGVVGEDTYNALYDAYDGIVLSLPPELFTDRARPYPGRVLSEGESGEFVLDLQRYLNRIARVYAIIPTLEEDGIFGPKTRLAVAAFQRLFRLPVTGQVNLQTWEEIAQRYDDLQAGEILREGQYPGESIGE